MLENLRNREGPWDLIVIGGGATGAGCCLDAAARGLEVLLVEQGDFGKGTSSRSTKLIHGGVRYLEQWNIRLVREALRERGILCDIAPDYVIRQPFVVPCYSVWEYLYYGIGLKLYDLLAGKRSLGRSTFLSRKAVIENLAGIAAGGLTGGIRYFDARFDDARLLIEILKNAASKGATVLNYSKVKELLKNPDGGIDGVRLECFETGEIFEPRAKAVLNATGAFSDKVRKLSKPESQGLVAASQGIHLVFDGEMLKSETALMIPKTRDGRVLFAIPFYGKLLVGTTDTPVETLDLEPSARDDEIDFILDTCAGYFENPPKRSDIRSVFAGIRPLVADSEVRNTAALSRGHVIEIDGNGLISVTGGKWTTYRNMAEDAVNMVVSSANLKAGPSVTAKLELDHMDEFEDTGLEELLSPDFEWTLADVVRSIRFEMARTVEDILARRTRILFLDANEAIRVAPIAAELLASELGFDAGWADAQVKAFRETAAGYSVSK